MKTTVHIADAILDEAQTIAARDGTTLKALVDEGLRKVISERQTRTRYALPDRSVDGEGLLPDLRGASWERTRALIYGEAE